MLDLIINKKSGQDYTYMYNQFHINSKIVLKLIAECFCEVPVQIDPNSMLGFFIFLSCHTSAVLFMVTQAAIHPDTTDERMNEENVAYIHTMGHHLFKKQMKNWYLQQKTCLLTVIFSELPGY